jgi:signal transduction histidine kinase
VITAFTLQGIIGLTLFCLQTWQRRDETAALIHALGDSFYILAVVFFAFSLTVVLLRFALAELLFVSFLLTAYTMMLPVLGAVTSAWIGVSAAMISRLLSIMQIAPIKTDPDERNLELIKTFGQFGTYGIPLVAGALVYEWMGGRPPVVEVSAFGVLRLAAAGLTMQITNNIVMTQMARAYGYSYRKHLLHAVVDTAIFTLTLPFAILVTLSYPALGWPAIAGWCLVGILGNIVGRKLALAQSASRELVTRLSSMANVGRTIALNVGTDELLRAIYESCKSAVDVSMFSIALVDESSSELAFQLDVRNGELLPRTRVPLGSGLTSYVVLNHEPLLLRSAAEEHRYGVEAFDDGAKTESWLGVPMIARDHVVGAITVQSYQKNRFTQDDVVLLHSIANQAAVALTNAQLYRDLQDFTTVLEQRVAERTSELQEINVRLVAADRSKSQFLANMSHELRTPLNSVIGFSGVLMRSARESLEPRLYRFIENIHSAGNHLLTLINDILDLSKIEAGRLQMYFETFDIEETIRGVERVMKGNAADLNIRIVCELDPRLKQVRLDEGRVKQILFNLLSNAVKFSHPDSVVRLTARNLDALESPLGCDSVKLTVQDNGIGISSNELPRIFDPFHQTEDGRRFSKHGTGLGLALTQNFAELLGGRIDVQSTLGSGSTFDVYLPLDGMQTAGRLNGVELEV